MSLEQQRIEQLQGLLAKIKRNAAVLLEQRSHRQAVPGVSPSSRVAAGVSPSSHVAAGVSPSSRAGQAALSGAAPTPGVRASQPAQPAASDRPSESRRPTSDRPAQASARPSEPAAEASRALTKRPSQPAPPVVSELDEAPQRLDDELLMTIPPSAAPPAAGDSSEFELPPAPVPGEFVSEPPSDEGEPPPISTRQQRGDDSAHEELEESLGFGADGAEDEEDFSASSPRTPPPESGPQVTIPPKEDKEGETRAAPGTDSPTMEQVGSTIELDEPGSFDLELADGEPRPTPDDTEAQLPPGEYAGTYDASLRPPENVQEELRTHAQAASERVERSSSAPSSPLQSSPAPQVASTPALGARPTEVVARAPSTSSAPAALYDGAAAQAEPRTFIERLDAALRLGTS